MSSQREQFEAAMGATNMDEFLEALNRGEATPEALPAATVSNDVYLACFSTPAGRAVLQDLYTRFVNGPSWSPGEPMEFAAYREGGKWAVLDMMHRTERAATGEDDDG